MQDSYGPADPAAYTVAPASLSRSAFERAEMEPSNHCPSLPEERLLALMKATSDVIYRMSPDWKIMTELYGKGFLADTEEPNRNWLDKYIHPDDQLFVTGVIGECIREKKTFELEHRVLREDGSVGWTYSRAIPLLDGDGGIREWFGAAGDITARKRAEEALRESEIKYRDLFDSIDEGFCIVEVLFDDYERPIDYRFLEVNRSFERQTGLVNAAGRCMLAIAPEHEQYWFDIYGRIALTGEPARFENPAEALGRFYDVHAFRVGEPEKRHVAILFNDITERKQAEEKIKKTNEELAKRTQEVQNERQRFFDVLETLPVMVCLITPDYHIAFANKAFREKFGESEGQHCHDFCCGYTSPCPFCESLIPLETGQPHHWEFTSSDGSTIIDAYDFPFTDIDGRSLILEMNIDITERRQMEKILRDSELRHTRELEEASRQKEDILESISDCFYALDKDLRFIYANKTAEEIWGLSRADLIGHKIGDVFTGLIDISLSKFYQVLEEQISQHYEVYSEIIQRWGDMSVFPTREGISVYFRDTTERKRAEETLRKNEERQAYMLKLSDALRPLSDAKSIQDAAASLLVEHLGVPQASYSEYTEDFIVIHREKLNDVNQNLSVAGTHKKSDFSECFAILRTGKNLIVPDVLTFPEYSGEERASLTALHIRAGISIPIMKEGKLVAVLTVRQATPREWTPGEVELVHETAERAWVAIERARAEGALRESEEKYRELVKHAPAGIYELDFRNNRFVSVNDVMCELTGYSREEFQDMSPSDFLDTEGKRFFRKRIDEWLSGGKPGPHADYKVLTKDGCELYASLNVRFTKDENGKPLGAMVIAHDVTMRRKMEEALRRSEEGLRSADKNKNNFISVLSHELRNPLAAIAAGISILEISDNKLQTEKVKEIMKRQIDQLCKLVDGLLEITRIAQDKIQLKKENINLQGLVMNAAKDIAPAFEKKGVQFSVEAQEKPILIHADPVRITQSIGNLLYNALKFTSEGGTVLLSLRQEINEAVITVKDNGIGISRELLSHLFQPFTQADNSLDRKNNGGLGLGLSIVKGIADMHEGTVTASSEGLGKGSLFAIRLPIITEIIKARDNNKADLCARVYRILVIEDSQDLAELSCSLLNMLGHEAFTAHDGMEGIAMAREIQPDIILCDIGLPGKSGYEVANIIKADNDLKNVLLVALTGYADEDSIKHAQENGFDRHLAKPVDMAALQQILNEYKR